MNELSIYLSQSKYHFLSFLAHFWRVFSAHVLYRFLLPLVQIKCRQHLICQPISPNSKYELSTFLSEIGLRQSGARTASNHIKGAGTSPLLNILILAGYLSGTCGVIESDMIPAWALTSGFGKKVAVKKLPLSKTASMLTRTSPMPGRPVIPLSRSRAAYFSGRSRGGS